jgi:hypothetical protein
MVHSDQDVCGVHMYIQKNILVIKVFTFDRHNTTECKEKESEKETKSGTISCRRHLCLSMQCRYSKESGGGRTWGKRNDIMCGTKR